jgi:hypothetical protein
MFILSSLTVVHSIVTATHTLHALVAVLIGDIGFVTPIGAHEFLSTKKRIVMRQDSTGRNTAIDNQEGGKWCGW